MGLDFVELILRVEEEFDIAIEDADAEQVSMPGQLCDLIERKLGVLDAEKRSFCPTSHAFYHVRRELMELGTPRANIKPNSSLHELLPRTNGAPLWRQLSRALPVELAPLERSDKVRSLLLIWRVRLGVERVWDALLSALCSGVPVWRGSNDWTVSSFSAAQSLPTAKRAHGCRSCAPCRVDASGCLR